MAAIMAPLIGSAWVMGENGEMLRNTGASWSKFASNRPNEIDAAGNLTLYHEPCNYLHAVPTLDEPSQIATSAHIVPYYSHCVFAAFFGIWAAGISGQLIKASDWGAGTWRAHATANRSRPLNKALSVYSRLRSGNWAAGAGTTIARNIGGGGSRRMWDLFAAHDVMHPDTAPVALYGKASEAAEPAAYLGDDCLNWGQLAADRTGVFGGQPMQLQGDTWHSTSYTLYCGNASRRDFRPFDAISFVSGWASSP